MPKQEVGNKLDSDVTIEVESDMRDKLLANLRSQARQSNASRQERSAYRRVVEVRKKGASTSKVGVVTAKISIVEGKPQAVLIKNRNENLTKDVTRLRSKYAKLLSE